MASHIVTANVEIILDGDRYLLESGDHIVVLEAHLSEDDEVELLRSPSLDVKSIADRHGVSVEFIEAQLEAGTEVEMEHTSNRDIARKIALDHLDEFENYYIALKEMEDKLKAEKAGRGDSVGRDSTTMMKTPEHMTLDNKPEIQEIP
jgi:predicted Zn-dependent protease